MSSKTVPSWATVNPWTMSAATPAVGKNLCGGVWTEAKAQKAIIDPLNGEEYLLVPDTSVDEIAPFVSRMKGCPAPASTIRSRTWSATTCSAT